MSSEKRRRPPPDEMRQKARDTARHLLAEGGPEQVKARDVAKAIGVSVGTVYNLFGDLNTLLFEVNGEVYDDLLKEVGGAADRSREAGEDVPLQLKALSRAYLAFVAERSDLWAGVLAFNRRRKSDVPDWYRTKERSLLFTLQNTLAPLMASSKAAHTELAPQALWAAVHGIISVSVGRDGLLATRDEIADQIDLVVTGVIRLLAE